MGIETSRGIGASGESAAASTSRFISHAKAALMRTRGLQNVLLVVVFAAIVAGLTFARQWLSTPPSTSSPAPVTPTTPASPLQFGGTTVTGGFNYEKSPARGYVDLWFENIKDESYELGLDQVSCKCAGVKVTLITEEESKKLRDWLPLAGATQAGLCGGGLLGVVGPAAFSLDQVGNIFLDNDRWQQMKRPDQEPIPFPLPGHSQGLIRLEWEGK